MKRSLLILLPALLCLSFNACNNQPAKNIFQQVVTKAGLPAGKKLLAVVFINPECPIAQNYTRTLNALKDSLGQSTYFVSVIPGNLFDDKKIEYFKQHFAFTLPVIKDEQYTITRALNATVYPQVVLLNQQSQTIYTGKIDNWYESIGNYRNQPTQFYLQQAIQSYIQKGVVAVNSTMPVGCYINLKNN